jgi:hypothetical protein
LGKYGYGVGVFDNFIRDGIRCSRLLLSVWCCRLARCSSHFKIPPVRSFRPSPRSCSLRSFFCLRLAALMAFLRSNSSWIALLLFSTAVALRFILSCLEASAAGLNTLHSPSCHSRHPAQCVYPRATSFSLSSRSGWIRQVGPLGGSARATWGGPRPFGGIGGAEAWTWRA